MGRMQNFINSMSMSGNNNSNVIMGNNNSGNISMVSNGDYTEISINGKNFTIKGNNISMINGKVYADGVEVNLEGSDLGNPAIQTIQLFIGGDTISRIKSDCKITVCGSVIGDIEAGNGVDIGGSVTGNIHAGNGIKIDKDLHGNADAGNSVYVGGKKL